MYLHLRATFSNLAHTSFKIFIDHKSVGGVTLGTEDVPEFLERLQPDRLSGTLWLTASELIPLNKCDPEIIMKAITDAVQELASRLRSLTQEYPGAIERAILEDGLEAIVLDLGLGNVLRAIPADWTYDCDLWCHDPTAKYFAMAWLERLLFDAWSGHAPPQAVEEATVPTPPEPMETLSGEPIGQEPEQGVGVEDEPDPVEPTNDKS